MPVKPPKGIAEFDSFFSEALANAPKKETPFRQPAEADLWRPVALVALFVRGCCPACGLVSSVLEGIYVRRVHARNHGEHLERCISPEILPPDLPKSIDFLDRDVPFCSRCIDPSWSRP